MPKSLFEKVWDAHLVEELPGGNALVFVDRVVAHEITTPQGALEIQRRYDDALFDPARIVAINDHVSPAKDTETAIHAKLLRDWARRHGIVLYDVGQNGICHVVAPASIAMLQSVMRSSIDIEANASPAYSST